MDTNITVNHNMNKWQVLIILKGGLVTTLFLRLAYSKSNLAPSYHIVAFGNNDYFKE